MKAPCPKGHMGGGGVARSVAVLDIYLTLKDALQAANVLHTPGTATDTFTYYFVAEDGSVFSVFVPIGWNFWGSPYIKFHTGPNAGGIQYITDEEAAGYLLEAESKYGRHIPGGSFCEDRFEPGTDRERLPLYSPDGWEIGYIDAEGEHVWPEEMWQPPLI